MSKIHIKQLNNSAATEGAIVIFDGLSNKWSNENTSAVLLPKGTTAERPSSPTEGQYRYNSSNKITEFWDGSEWVSTAPNLLYRHNGAITQTITSTYSTILFDSSVRNDSDYSYTSGVVTFQRAGWYKINYDIGIDNNNAVRTTSQIAAFVDSVIHPGSNAWGYHRNAFNGQNTVSATFMLQSSIGTTLDIQAKYVNGNVLVTLENSSRLFIERLE